MSAPRSFVADSPGPPKRKLYIWQDEPSDEPNIVSGFGFAVSSFDSGGNEEPLWDAWEETWAEILRYPPEYAPLDIVWRCEGSDESVDIYHLTI